MCACIHKEKWKTNEAKYKQLVKLSKEYMDSNPLNSSYNIPANLILCQNQKFKKYLIWGNYQKDFGKKITLSKS